MKRYTITITDEAANKAQAEIVGTGRTVAQWIAWLVEEYIPADDVPLNEDD